MILHEGLPPSRNSNIVCKLLRPLYGHKQSPIAWYQWLNQHLLLYEFQWLESNPNICIKRKKNDHGLTITIVHFDD